MMNARDYVIALCVMGPLALTGLAVTIGAGITTGGNLAAIAYAAGFTVLPTAATIIAAYGLHETRRDTRRQATTVPRQRVATR